jgi:SAM-dependent methyltransferase
MSPLANRIVTLRGEDGTSISARFDALLSVFSIWWVIGLYLDGRSHLAGGHWEFFTAEHAVLYTTFPLFGMTFFLLFASNWDETHDTIGDIPNEYLYSLVGTALFGIGGVMDLYWHQAVLATSNAWVIFSPPHLLLLVSGGLIVSGPLQSRWRYTEIDPDTGRWWMYLPVLLATSAILLVAGFVTMFVNPFVNPLAAVADSSHLRATVPPIQPSFHLTQELGILSILLQTVILMVVILVLVRRFSLPFGSFTLLFGINAALVSLLANQVQFFPVIVAAGITADGLYVWAQSRLDSVNALRLFAFAVPIVLFVFYFLQISFVGTIAWGTVTWTGTIVLSGIVGLSVSYFVQPPASPSLGAEPTTDFGTPGMSAETRANVETFSSSEANNLYIDRATDGLFLQEQKAIERYFSKPDARVLDLGCGTGRVTHRLSEMGYDVIGVDPSDSMIDVATSVHPQIDFVVGDGTDLHFQDDAFDYVLFSYYGLDYIYPEEQRIRALREIYRVLKPGGIFVFSSHNWWNSLPSTVYEGTSALQPLLNRDNVLDPRDRYAPVEVKVGETLVYLSSPAKQRQQLQRCGFKMLDIVGKRDTVLRYVEAAPHYVAQKPIENP